MAVATNILNILSCLNVNFGIMRSESVEMTYCEEYSIQ